MRPALQQLSFSRHGSGGSGGIVVSAAAGQRGCCRRCERPQSARAPRGGGPGAECPLRGWRGADVQAGGGDESCAKVLNMWMSLYLDPVSRAAWHLMHLHVIRALQAE